MIVDDLDIRGPSVGPNKTEPELIVQSNGMLALAIPAQGFEPISRRETQIIETSSVVQHEQLAFRGPDQVGWKPFAGHPTLQNTLREPVFETHDRQGRSFWILVSRNDTFANRRQNG
jgi:hypothetical protein